jgi:hypothetical protein
MLLALGLISPPPRPGLLLTIHRPRSEPDLKFWTRLAPGFVVVLIQIATYLDSCV